MGAYGTNATESDKNAPGSQYVGGESNAIAKTFVFVTSDLVLNIMF